MTSHHYPQLVGPAALDAIARVRALALAKLIGLQSAPPNLADTTYSQVGGNKVSPDTLVEIRTELVDIAKRYGFPNSRSQEGLRKFDSESAKQLHMLMEISPNEASRNGIWVFLSCQVMPGLVRWRFPGDLTEGTAAERFGGGVRNCFQRLWWRAEILKDPNGKSSYWILEKLGEDEIVQLMERPSVRADRRLARLSCKAFLAALEKNPELSRMALMRDIQPRILRYMSFVAFEALSDGELDAMLGGIVKQSIEAMR